MIKKLFLFLFVLLLVNCNTRIEILNDQKDLLIADSLVNQFYKRLNKDRNSLSMMFENENYRIQFINALKIKDSTLGIIKKAKFNYLTTNRIEYNDTIIVNYYVESEIMYEKGSTKEEVEFRKTNKKFNMISYHFNFLDF
jgi:hypothetical protein